MSELLLRSVIQSLPGNSVTLLNVGDAAGGTTQRTPHVSHVASETVVTRLTHNQSRCLTNGSHKVGSQTEVTR